MKIFWASLLLLGSSCLAFPASQQELVPVIREIRTTSPPSLSEWKTYLRVADIGGISYMSLVQVTELLNGQLHLHPVSKSVDLSLGGHTIVFPYYSAQVRINRRRVPIRQPTVKNDGGVWVPASFFA